MACNLSRAPHFFVWGALALAGSQLGIGCGSDSDGGEPTGSAGSGSATAGAGGSSAAGGGGAGQATAGSSSGTGGSGEELCESIITEYPPASANHTTACSALSFDSNPPAGGDHYAVWAAYQTYDYPVPAGFLVHALEHGAIVYWYNCPDGCADEVASAQAMVDALPVDPLCAGTSSERRVILVPSPELDVRWAASSWGYIIKANCFDADALRTFYTDHVGRAREQLCNDGQPIPSDACP
jgi:hypothetical protein